MPTTNPPTPDSRSGWASDTACLAYIGIGTIFIHLLTGNRYGWHRDELAVFDDARHLAWGYVVYPPITPLFARVGMTLFGTSLVGFRFFAALVQAIAVFLTGLMARELGGKREAQILAALASVPFCLGGGALMQYISFDYICWVLTSYCMIRLLRTDNPRWLLAGGVAMGLGMLSKYTMAFFICGVVGGLFLTHARRFLLNKWFWTGLGAAILIFLPNLIWQFRHQFVSLDFLHFLHERDVSAGLTKDFLQDQLEQSLLAIPLWLAGLWFYFVSKDGWRFRPLGWMYVITLLLFMFAKGRGYYLAPAYPMLYSAGAVVFEGFFAQAPATWTRFLRPTLWSALIVSIIGAMAIALPIAPIKSRWWYAAAEIDTALPDEIGWPEFVGTIAKIRDSLPAEQRENVGILAGNYGEVGAINLFGPHYGLPLAISGVNSSWERGYGNPPPQTLIVAGFWKEFVDDHFSSCRVAAQIWNSYGIENEETFEHPYVFVCGPPLKGWPEFWKDFQMFALREPRQPQVPLIVGHLPPASLARRNPFA